MYQLIRVKFDQTPLAKPLQSGEPMKYCSKSLHILTIGKVLSSRWYIRNNNLLQVTSFFPKAVKYISAPRCIEICLQQRNLLGFRQATNLCFSFSFREVCASLVWFWHQALLHSPSLRSRFVVHHPHHLPFLQRLFLRRRCHLVAQPTP